MKLKEAIIREARPNGPTCTIARLLAELPPADAQDLAECLNDTAYTNTQISRGLIAEGHHVRSQTVQRHRGGECNCAQ